MLAGVVQQVIDQFLLVSVERDDTDRVASSHERGIGKALDCLADNGFGFSLVVAPFALCINTFNPAPLHSTCAGLCCREGDEITVVVTVIGERNQAFVATPVVPAQTVTWHPCSQALVQNTFHVFSGIVVAGIRATVEKVRRRHLTRVACDNDLPASSYRTDRVPWSDLRSLVENDQIEWRLISGQELRNRQRAHQHARRQTIQRVAHFNSQLPDRFVTAGLLQFMLENGKAAALGYVIFGGDQATEFRPDITHCQLRHFVVQANESADVAHVFGSHEIPQQRFTVYALRGEPMGIGRDEGFLDCSR